MPTTNLSFAKIAATPTDSSWSQAYNSGSLFITLALSTSDENQQGQLPSLGKTVLGLLESEIYGLEEKNIAKISEAILISVKELPPEVTPSLSLCFVKESALYAFVLGTGTVLLKRGKKIGPILEITEATTTPTGGSGYLDTNDLVLIQTAQFARSVSQETVTKALEYGLPNDIAETISPHVHGEKEGGAALIILSYKGVSRSHEAEEDELLAQTETATLEDASIKKQVEPVATIATQPSNEIQSPRPIINQPIEEGEPATSPFEKLSSVLSNIKIPFISNLDPRKKITLIVAALLILILAGSIIFVSASQESSKNKALFDSLYSSAKDDFEAGNDLLSLNPTLARDDLLRAQETLAKADGKFKDGSDEKQQIDDLKGKVEEALSGTEGRESISTTEAEESDSPGLSAMIRDSNIISVAEFEGNSYLLSESGVSKIEKGAEEAKSIIKNDSTWKGARSIGAFGSNLYVLDKESLIKLVPTGSTYTDSAYLKDETDLTDAISMTIDSSIYILFKDGSVSKFTKGTKDSFSISGLTSALSSPIAIATTEDADKIYILDPKNERVVALNKDGAFAKQYQSKTLSTASAMTLSQDGKTGYILSGKKVYKISF